MNDDATVNEIAKVSVAFAVRGRKVSKAERAELMQQALNDAAALVARRAKAEVAA